MSKLHRDNAGYVGCSYEETQDPFYESSRLALTMGESDKTCIREEETLTVTVNGSQKFVINGTQQDSLTLKGGAKYTFDQSHSSNSGHPLRIGKGDGELSPFYGDFTGNYEYLRKAGSGVLAANLEVTIECHIKPYSSTVVGLFDGGAGETSVLRNYTANRIEVQGQGSNGASFTVTPNVWQHFAVVISGGNNGTIKVYIDGQLNGTGSYTSYAGGSNFDIGGINVGADGVFEGRIRNFRVTGSSVYAANFIAPPYTTNLSAITGTRLLTLVSNSSDASSNSYTITNNGVREYPQAYSAGVVVGGTPGSNGYTTVVLPPGQTDLYYYCANHAGMGGTISVRKNEKMFDGGLPLYKAETQFAEQGKVVSRVPDYPTNVYVDNVLGYYLNGNPPLFLTKQPDGTDVRGVVAHGASTGSGASYQWAVDDVLQWAIDTNTGNIWLGRNNTWYVNGDPANGNYATISCGSRTNYLKSPLFLGIAYNSSTFKLEIPSTASYSPPSGFSYWSGPTNGTWKGSGTLTSSTPGSTNAGEIFSEQIPTEGKVYIEAIIKGGVGLYASVGLMNEGDTPTYDWDIDAYSDYLIVALPLTDGLYQDYSATIKGSGTNKTVVSTGGSTNYSNYILNGSSWDLNADNKYLSVYGQFSNTPDFAMDGDFTIEAWIYRDRAVGGGTGTILGDYYEGSVNTSPNFQFVHRGNDTEELGFYCALNAQTTISIGSDNKAFNNCWNHCVVQRRGRTFTFYINGIESGTYSNSAWGGTVGKGRNWWVGIDANAVNEPFQGYIQDLKVYKGIAKYSDNFTPPRRLDIQDKSRRPIVAAVKGTVFDETAKLFYNGAIQFRRNVVGTSNPDYINLGDTGISLNHNAYTIEFWMNVTQDGGDLFWTGSQWSNNQGILCSFSSSKRVGFHQGSGGGISSIQSHVLNHGQWYHCAIVADITNVTMFIDGTPVGSSAQNHSIGGAGSDFLIGAYRDRNYQAAPRGGITGYMQDFKIYSGVAKYTSQFTPSRRSIKDTARRYPSGVFVVS